MLWNHPDLVTTTLALVRARGMDAPATAEARAHRERAEGNRVGFAVWMMIKDAAEELLREQEPTDRTH
jgi:hypothetical protein